jgi:hypothetical protein
MRDPSVLTNVCVSAATGWSTRPDSAVWPGATDKSALQIAMAIFSGLNAKLSPLSWTQADPPCQQNPLLYGFRPL